MTDQPAPKKPWSSLQRAAVTVVLSLIAGLLLSALGAISRMSNQTSQSCRARQIIMAMKIYANDHNGDYPDSVHSEIVTANQAFRRLFQDDIIQDERIFGGIRSPFAADGNIGTKPDFKEAVAPVENHWAIIAKQTTNSSGINPLVFENAIDANWPPRWRSDLAGQRVRGRAWKNRTIVLGRNDNSVNVEKLEEGGEFLMLKWRHFLPPDLKVLDIEEGKGGADARRFHLEDILPGC